MRSIAHRDDGRVEVRCEVCGFPFIGAKSDRVCKPCLKERKRFEY